MLRLSEQKLIQTINFSEVKFYEFILYLNYCCILHLSSA